VTAKASTGATRTLSGSRVRRGFGLPAEWITGITLPSSTPPPAPSPSPPATGTTPPAAGSGAPSGLVPTGTSAVFSRSGTRVVAGRTWRTTCSTTAQYGYRCAASYRGTVYRRNAAGRWGPVTTWVPERVSYYDTVGSAWTGNLRATRGRRTVKGTVYSTTCTKATGARTCTTRVLAEQIGRRRQGSGYFYYRFKAWKVSSTVVLNPLD